VDEVVVDDVEDVCDEGLQENHVRLAQAVQGAEDENVKGEHGVAG